MKEQKIEWSWDDSPILLPLAFEAREWNAVFIAFILAECSGATINILHVKSSTDDPGKKESLLKRIEALASELKVKYTVKDADARTGEPSVSEIAKIIVSTADESRCQAIVMAAHRESFFRELFGRISDRVARDSRHMVVLVETPHRAATIPRRPSKILIPILSEAYDASPYIIASALTSTATTPDSELVVARVVQLPPTTPLDAMEVSKTLKMLEKSFSYYVANSIQSLGRLFTPRILPVREVGRDVAAYVQDIEADAIVLWSDKPAGFRKLLPREAYDIVAKAPCVVLVVFHKKR